MTTPVKPSRPTLPAFPALDPNGPFAGLAKLQRIAAPHVEAAKARYTGAQKPAGGPSGASATDIPTPKTVSPVTAKLDQGASTSGPNRGASTGAATTAAIPDGQGGSVPVPPAPAPYLPPALPAAATGAQITPERNMIGTSIMPAPDPRVTKLDGMSDTLLDQMVNGPDRFAMAQDKFKSFTDATDPTFRHALQDATNAGATYGQLGSGTLTNKYGDLEQLREQQLINERSGLFQDALDSSITDRLNNLGAVEDVSGTAYARGANDRGEARGERDYQNQLALQALAQRLAERQLSNQERGQDFSQALDMYNVGEGSNPANAELDAAAQEAAAAQGGISGIGQLLMQLMRNNAAGDPSALYGGQ